MLGQRGTVLRLPSEGAGAAFRLAEPPPLLAAHLGVDRCWHRDGVGRPAMLAKLLSPHQSSSSSSIAK
jgi:hypothetical protein